MILVSDLEDDMELECTVSNSNLFIEGKVYRIIEGPRGIIDPDGEEEMYLSDEEGKAHRWTVEAITRSTECYKDWPVQFKVPE